MLASAIAVSASMTAIDVGNNSIGKEAALSLVSIFKEKDQMQSVGLARLESCVRASSTIITITFHHYDRRRTLVARPDHGPRFHHTDATEPSRQRQRVVPSFDFSEGR